jgi:hypothetical protein
MLTEKAKPTYTHTFAFPSGGSTVNEGLTKRELFAALAMHGMLMDSGGDQPPPELVATMAFGYADALIAHAAPLPPEVET